VGDQTETMASNSEGLKIIKSYAESFHESVEKFTRAQVFNQADCEDAYARAARARERYLEEKRSSALNNGELTPLSRVFENDVFTEGMMNIRHVGEHVIRREEFIIRTPGGEPIKLSTATSAMAMFAGFTVTLNDTGGKPHQIDHRILLCTLDERYSKAIKNAENS